MLRSLKRALTITAAALALAASSTEDSFAVSNVNESGDVVQMQDHMTFRMLIGGKPTMATLTWAAEGQAKN